jgi:hypothetical protein
MTMVPVTSSNVAAVGHDPASGTLRVKFKSGAIYEYSGVSAAKHQAMMASTSKGKHLAEHVYPHHESTRVK